MFTRGSRYRNLPESARRTATGEWIRGKNLRLLPAREDLLAPPGQQVTHTVLAGDRLDLLAFKYYGDTTKWWQIADANPEHPFPTDLLGQGPLVREDFSLAHADFLERYQQLLVALGALGTVRPRFVSYFEGDETAGVFFVEETVVVAYATSAATRQAILTALQGQGFQLLHTSAWEEGADTVEAFTFEDPAAKGGWRALLRGLEEAPGVVELQSDTAELMLRVVYNGALVRRESLLGLMGARGFVAQSVIASRVGAQILVPPNQIV